MEPTHTHLRLVVKSRWQISVAELASVWVERLPVLQAASKAASDTAATQPLYALPVEEQQEEAVAVAEVGLSTEGVPADDQNSSVDQFSDRLKAMFSPPPTVQVSTTQNLDAWC